MFYIKQQLMDTDIKTYKVVFVGESKSGKTSIIKERLNLELPTTESYSLFDNYLEVRDNIKLHICDPSGKEEYDRLKRMSYLNTDVFVLCIECTKLQDGIYLNQMIQPLKKMHKPIILCVTKCDTFKMNKNTHSENSEVIKHKAVDLLVKYSLSTVLLVSIKRKRSISTLFNEIIKYAELSEERKVPDGLCACIYPCK